MIIIIIIINRRLVLHQSCENTVCSGGVTSNPRRLGRELTATVGVHERSCRNTLKDREQLLLYVPIHRQL